MKRLSFLIFLIAGLLQSSIASATHKNWLLKNGGAECAFASLITSQERYPGLLENTFTSDRTAICPVALAARWGDSNYPSPFPPPRSADARSAIVYGYNPTASSSLSCYAVAQTSDGSLYYSQTISKGGQGVARLDIATDQGPGGMGNWGYGSSLEQSDLYIQPKSLDFNCTVAKNGGRIYGYKVKMCQYQAECGGRGLTPEPEADTVGAGPTGENVVQISGAECVPETGILRNLTGVSGGIYCPIAPPSDDTKEHPRYLSGTQVYYSGGTTNSDCVSVGTCPTCALVTYDRNGTRIVGKVFTKSDGRVLHQPEPGAAKFQIGYETNVGLSCTTTKSLTTIQGATSYISISTIQGGT
jgi:hypothetical protein